MFIIKILDVMGLFLMLRLNDKYEIKKLRKKGGGLRVENLDNVHYIKYISTW